jgi:hypothetical protein
VIEVRRQALVTADVECILRSVGSTLEPLTAIAREVGAAAGEDIAERIEQLGDLPVGGVVITPARGSVRLVHHSRSPVIA